MLPESIPCDKCELTAWLRKKKADGKPFYVCKNSHFQNVGGDNKPSSGGGDRKETSRVSKIVCPCCSTDIIVDVHASSFQNGAKPKAKAQDEPETETSGDDIPF
jgi:hypothetical protein